MLAESSVRLMRRLVEQEPAQLVQDFVELADCATNGPVGGANDVLRIVEMVRRQADTALEALGAVGEPYLGDLLAGRLPYTSMLRLALVGEPDPQKRARRFADLRDDALALSPSERQKSEFAAFRNELSLVVTGERVRRASNVVVIGGAGLSCRMPTSSS